MQTIWYVQRAFSLLCEVNDILTSLLLTSMDRLNEIYRFSCIRFKISS